MSERAAELCDCGEPLPIPAFDLDAAEHMTATEVRSRWPRTDHVCKCGARMILYASFEHYIAGDW